MSWFKITCRRFRRLCEEREDRELSTTEVAFIEEHRTDCRSCFRYDVATSHSLNMLRSVVMDPDPNPTYDERVMRMVRLDRGRDTFSYWFPMAIGAGIASFAVFALMQLVTMPHDLKSTRAHGMPAENVAPATRKLLPPVDNLPITLH